MKKISMMLLMPLLAFGQPMNHPENDFVSLDIEMENSVQNVPDNRELNDISAIAMVNPKTPVGNNKVNVAPNTVTLRTLPKHLNTFSLSGQALEKPHSFAPQERLDTLLAMNDIEFPKEDTLLKGLNAVRYEHFKFGNAGNISEGFGPKIRF